MYIELTFSTGQTLSAVRREEFQQELIISSIEKALSGSVENICLTLKVGKTKTNILIERLLQRNTTLVWHVSAWDSKTNSVIYHYKSIGGSATVKYAIANFIDDHIYALECVNVLNLNKICK